MSEIDRKYLNEFFNYIIPNSKWVLNKLIEEQNIPDDFSILKNAVYFYIHINKEEEKVKDYIEVEITKNSVCFGFYEGKKMPYFKKYLILPEGGICKKEMFLINKEIEYVKEYGF